jgi:hypothetical protein
MTLARLLAAALLICSGSALAQGQQFQSSRLVGKASTASEPWRIFPNPPSNLGSGQEGLDPTGLSHYDFSQFTEVPDVRNFKLNNGPVTLFTPDWLVPEGDATCLAIRSYVVARDSKGSDSTHLVSYSTCQPSARYRVKTTEMRSVIEYR